MNDLYMKEALALARRAEALGEVPVGAVIVRDGVIVGRGHNRCETEKNPLLHAEILAITEALSVLGEQRLCGCEMYVTLEPCAMCAGAIINSRIDKVYIAVTDDRYGSMGSVCSLQYYFPEKPTVVYGVLEEECKNLLSDFFKGIRRSKS